MKILGFAEIETFVSTVQINNPSKDKEEMARAFLAKSVYNFQTTRALMERLHVDKTLRILCGWRYHTHIPSEPKFSRVFDEFSKSVHDSSLALPMINETSAKVNYLYDLSDAAYDSNIIRTYSINKGHRPIIDISPKNSKALKVQIALAKSEKEILRSFNLSNDSDDLRYNQRSSVERVNAYLKDNFGCDKIYYLGATKVASVLAFGVLSLCIHQSLKLVT